MTCSRCLVVPLVGVTQACGHVRLWHLADMPFAPRKLLLTQADIRRPKAKGPGGKTRAFSIRSVLGAAFVAVFTSEGLMRVYGYKSTRSGSERKGDQCKSEGFSHAHISSRTLSIPLAGQGIYDRQLTFA